MKKEQERSLDYKRYEVGNFYIEKYKEEYNEDMLQSPSGISEFAKELGKREGYIPYIKIGDKPGMVQVKYIFGSDMYFFLDSFETEDGEITKESLSAADTLLMTLFLGNSIVGAEYWIAVSKLQVEYTKKLLGETDDNE